LKDLSGWKLAHRDQDIRGWPVRDDSGRELGKVDEMIVDTDTRHVETVVLHNGTELPVAALDIGMNEVRVDREYAARYSGTGGLMSHVTPEHSTTREHSTPFAGHEDRIAIPVIEEHLEIGKQRVESTGARVHTEVRERPVEKEVTLRDEHVTVHRRPVDRMATEKDLEAAARGNDIEVKTVHEEPVTRKRSKVVEEVVIDTEARDRKETVRGTERKIDVDLDTGDNPRKK
jgi:stress response protein YsnF